MSVPKHYVFDDEGKLTEVRGYKDEVVVERWGIVYDEEDKPVGLKPLPVKEVIPQSILDRMKFWRKPKPLTQILSIDFIGLIQYIGMIYKIRKVVTIEEIEKILEIINIKKVDVIGEISTIRDVTHRPLEFIVNAHFMEGFVGWVATGVYGGGEGTLEFSDLQQGVVSQKFLVPLGVDWWEELYLYLESSFTGVNLVDVDYYYTDETTSSETLQVSGIVPEKKVLSPTAGKKLKRIRFFHQVSHRACTITELTTVF